MIHRRDQLISLGNGRYQLPCCGLRCVNPQETVVCGCGVRRQDGDDMLLPPRDPLAHPPRGLGDTIERLLLACGIRKRPGCGCGRRQEWLNRLVPYRR